MFLLLEGVSIWLIISKNSYPRSAFLHSSAVLVAKVLDIRSGIASYFQLKEVNEALTYENAKLILDLEYHKSLTGGSGTRLHKDTLGQTSISYQPAKVVNNSYLKTNNYLTINRGRKDGVDKGMGVLSNNGVVGLVHEVSDHYATVISLLNPKLMISCRVKPSNSLGVVQWKAGNAKEASVNFVPRHIPIQYGDSVFTSGFNSALPEGLFIGTISKKELKADEAFHQLKVLLSLDFSTIDYVYVYKSSFKAERDSLESKLSLEP